MGYKKHKRCKDCKKIYKCDNVPKICPKCGAILILLSPNLFWGQIATEHLETIIAKKKFPFGYDVKEEANKDENN
jgi:hypothetical protein